jgi:hypothetical protein
MITKKDLARAWEKTKQGYGKAIGYVQENAPKLEQRFGRMAQTATDAFAVRPTGIQPDFSTPRRNEFVQLPLKRPMRPIKRVRRHDFGSLSFDI